jgi:hypothetical protein
MSFIKIGSLKGKPPNVDSLPILLPLDKVHIRLWIGTFVRLHVTAGSLILGVRN